MKRGRDRARDYAEPRAGLVVQQSVKGSRIPRLVRGPYLNTTTIHLSRAVLIEKSIGLLKEEGHFQKKQVKKGSGKKSIAAAGVNVVSRECVDEMIALLRSASLRASRRDAVEQVRHVRAEYVGLARNHWRAVCGDLLADGSRCYARRDLQRGGERW